MSVLLDKMVVKSIRCCLGLVVSSGRIGPTDQPCGGYHSTLGSTRDQARWRLSYPLAQWMYRAWLILELWFDNAQLDVGLSIFPLARSLLPKWAFQALARWWSADVSSEFIWRETKEFGGKIYVGRQARQNGSRVSNIVR